ncbi:MAG TPA: hypothetical protein IAC60_00240 [Candidatus Enterosoma merdigallinarum]|nr:hypothetical protein [Candidatus Enterosoma merdigallinarum]
MTADFPEECGTSVTLSIKNNGTAEASLRADVLAEGGTTNIATSATVDGVDAPVVTGEWPAGPSFKVAAGKTVTLVLNYETKADKLNLFVDSAVGDETARSGSIYVSGFAIAGETPADPEPDTPSEEGEAYAFYPSDTSYTATNDESGCTITYTDLGGSSYKTLTADFPAGTESARSVTFTIENKGANEVKFRFDILGTDEKTMICTSASQDGTDISATIVPSTEQYPSGPSLAVAAGKTSTVTIGFSAEATKLNAFVDSARGDSATYSGTVVLSDFIAK